MHFHFKLYIWRPLFWPCRCPLAAALSLATALLPCSRFPPSLWPRPLWLVYFGSSPSARLLRLVRPWLVRCAFSARPLRLVHYYIYTIYYNFKIIHLICAFTIVLNT